MDEAIDIVDLTEPFVAPSVEVEEVDESAGVSSPPPNPPVPSTPTKKGPAPASFGRVVSRASTVPPVNDSPPANALTLNDSYESNLIALSDKTRAVAQADRGMAISMLQVHLDRGEQLDALPLSHPVATTISDNTTACLKSLELAHKAGNRILEVAKLLVEAKKADDSNTIKAYQAQLAAKKLNGDNDDEWGEIDDLPT